MQSIRRTLKPAFGLILREWRRCCRCPTRFGKSHLDVERTLGMMMCISFWAATLSARLITASATANLILISPLKCNLQNS